jgi:RNA polymerase sigma-70 factor (ECF subfamily)
MSVIHTLPFHVACPVNVTTLIVRFEHDHARSGQWGVVLPFRGRISAADMTEATQRSDGTDYNALIQAVAQCGDRAAFANLFEYFAPRVKAWMLRGGSDAAAAEELAQDTMLAVWQKAASFDASRAGASTWIFTIARNLRIDRVRRERHPSELMPHPLEARDGPPQADHMMSIDQQERRIRDALSQLPAEQAEVIRKAFFEDKVHAEIEKELSIPLGTVKSRLRLAMNRLRAALGDLT